MGFGWDKIENVLWRLQDGELEGICPKAAVLLLGTNNLSENTSLEIAAGIDSVCRLIRHKLPVTRILLLGIFPRGEKNAAVRQKIKEVNNLISEFDDGDMLSFLDIGNVFLDENGRISRKIMQDLLHPTAKGYNRWARAMEPALQKILTRKNSAAVPTEKLSKWWQDRHQRKLKLAEKNRKNTELLLIGDSITHALDKEPCAVVMEKFFKKYNPHNLGFGADRTENVLWRLANGELTGINPKLAVIMIGTNNTDGEHYPTTNSGFEVAEGIIKICQQVRRQLPQTKILLLSIFPFGKDPDNKRRADNAEASLIASNIADGKNVFYCDLNDCFLNPDKTINTSIMPDYLHPSPAGDWIWAKNMQPVIDTILNRE